MACGHFADPGADFVEEGLDGRHAGDDDGEVHLDDAEGFGWYVYVGGGGERETYVQMAKETVDVVASRALAGSLRDWTRQARRTQLAIVTLCDGMSTRNRVTSLSTYKIPAPNMLIAPSFCLSGSCKPRMTGTGMARTNTSAVICNEANARPTAAVLMHHPYGRPSQSLFKGRHAKIVIRSPTIVYNKM